MIEYYLYLCISISGKINTSNFFHFCALGNNLNDSLQWKFTSTRPNSWGMQLSDITVFKEGIKVNLLHAESDCPNSVDFEGPKKAIDGNLDTKWLCKTSGNVRIFTIYMDKFSSNDLALMEFQLCTANDSPPNDPLRWILSDGSGHVIHKQSIDYNMPYERKTCGPKVSLGKFEYTSAPIIFKLLWQLYARF